MLTSLAPWSVLCLLPSTGPYVYTSTGMPPTSRLYHIDWTGQYRDSDRTDLMILMDNNFNPKSSLIKSNRILYDLIESNQF